MKIIKQGYEVLSTIGKGGIEELQSIERAARTCYKSESRITEDGESAKKLVRMLIDRGHEAMLEHSQLSVKFICDRGISHELVRHRLASFAQESTRYCNYSGGKFDNEITVIEPSWIGDNKQTYQMWKSACERAEIAYMDLMAEGCSPQEARAVLPNSLKTEVVMTANYREWRHFFKLRTDAAAHPDMRALVTPLLLELKERIPVVFDL